MDKQKQVQEGEWSFTEPPLLQESRLTSSGSPNLVGLVEWKFLWSGKWELQRVSIHFIHDCTIALYKQLIQTGSVLLLLTTLFAFGYKIFLWRLDFLEV